MKSKSMWLLLVAASNLCSVSQMPWPVSFHKIRPDSGGRSASSKGDQTGRNPPVSSTCVVLPLLSAEPRSALWKPALCASRATSRTSSSCPRLCQRRVRVFGAAVWAGTPGAQLHALCCLGTGCQWLSSTLSSTKLVTSVSWLLSHDSF